jgi:hypothetical protein
MTVPLVALDDAAIQALRVRMRAGLENYWATIVTFLPELETIDWNAIIGTNQMPDVKTFIIEEFLKVLFRYEPDVTPPGAKKAQFGKISKATRSLIQAIDQLDPARKAEFLTNRVDIARIRDDLLRARNVSDRLAPRRVPRSGRGSEDRVAYAKKLLAAEFAYHMMHEWCHRRPTRTTGGSYFSIAKILYNLATDDGGSVEYACREYWETRSSRS